MFSYLFIIKSTDLWAKQSSGWYKKKYDAGFFEGSYVLWLLYGCDSWIYYGAVLDTLFKENLLVECVKSEELGKKGRADAHASALLGLDFFVKYHPRGNSNCRFLVVNFSFDPSTMPKIVEVAYVHFLWG